MTATSELWELYKKHRSVWRVAEEVGIGGQSVHERLTKAGYKLYGAKFSPEEDAEIRKAYEQAGDMRSLDLKKLAEKLKRPTHTNVCRRARTLGLTKTSRKHTVEQRDANSIRVLADLKQGKMGRTYSNIIKGWFETRDGRKYFLKSSWETSYAIHLEMLLSMKAIASWEYEPDTFWFDRIKRGVRSYTPDFKITFPDGDIEYHEVKGWMDSKSKTKIKRMGIYHKSVKLVVIEKQDMRRLGLI